MDDRHSEEEKAKRKKRENIKNELDQLVQDFACLAASDQPKFEGLPDEPIPQVMGCGDDATINPRNVIVALNLTGKNFVANADTIDQAFCLDGSVETERARQFLGMCVDTFSLYHPVSQGVTPPDLKPSYRQKTAFPSAVSSKLNCTTSTVQGFMECIRLPRDLYNESHDTFLRLWFTLIRSPSHATQDYNCMPFKAALEARQIRKFAAYGKGDCLRWGADESNDAEAFLTNWNAFHDSPEDESDVRDSDPKTNMGLSHPLVFGNPRSKYFSTVKDREDLLATIPNDEAKPVVVALRQHILRLKNNPQSYIQQHPDLEDVFRPHDMKSFYKMPRDAFVPGEIKLASQNMGNLKTPSGIEKHMPQHVKICDTHLLLHKRPSNEKHYTNLRELLPLHSRRVTKGNQIYTELSLQSERVTPEGYWPLWIPSTIQRNRVVVTKQASISSPQYLFDLVNTNMQDRKVSFSRYDTRTPKPIGKYNPENIIRSTGVGGEDDFESDAYESDEMSDDGDDDDDELFGGDEIFTDDEVEDRYNDFLLAVGRFVKGHTGKTHKTTHLPMWMWEQDENGNLKPFNERSEETEAKGVYVEIPYLPDWVEAHRVASQMPEGTDPQIVESVKKATNAHVTEALGFVKTILSKTRFHTQPICLTHVADILKRDEQGRKITEPDLDENGEEIVGEDGMVVVRNVYDHVAVRVGIHYIRPMPKNRLHMESMALVAEYCGNTSNPGEKPLPLLYENCPKNRAFEKEWVSGNFSNNPEASQKAKCWWEQKRHPAKSNPRYVAALKQYIENGVMDDVKGLSPGPDYTRAQFSVTQALLIENSITFKNGEMGIDYLENLGLEWVKKVAKSTNAEWYIKKAIQPWFDDTYMMDENNKWVVKHSVEYPEIWRIDPDHAFEDVFEVMLHTLFDHIGSVYNQYKYCHLVYATFGTAFQKPESNELADQPNSTGAVVKFVGDTATGKSHKCSHVLCFFKKDRHVLDEQGNSALCGLGVIWDYRECAISFSDETNEDKDQEQLRQEKTMQTQGFISRGRSAKKMCPDGVERWVPDVTNNRTNMARVACVNEEAKGGENVKANEDRCLKIYAQESRLSCMKPKSMHGATCRTLKSAIMAQHFQDSRVSEEGKRVLAKMVEHTERLAAIEAFITTLPSEARNVDMEVAHIRWRDIAAFMTDKGVVWNDRPRLYTTMLQLARFKSVEMAALAAFEGQRRSDGSKIPFTPENYWEIIPYMYTTERTACKVFHYCATEGLGVNYNFPIMNSLFEAAARHDHMNGDEAGVRTRFMQSNKYDAKKGLVVVYKISRKAGRSYYSPTTQLPTQLRVKWAKLAQKMYGVNKEKHDFAKDWERFKKGKNSLSDWKVRQQKEGDTIEIANQESEHTVYTFPDVEGLDRDRLPIVEKIDPNIEPYNDEDFVDAITVEVVKGNPPTNEGEPDYSRDEYAIVQFGLASFRYTIDQRHARGRREDMKDDDVIDVVKEFEKVDKNLIKQSFIEVCSYKNNMKDPCQPVIKALRKQERSKKPTAYSATDAKNPLYYRERAPGMRDRKCFDDGVKTCKQYRVMTIAEPPTFHGGEVLNAVMPNTLVITENKTKVQGWNLDHEEIMSTAAALGANYYKAKTASKEKKSRSKPLRWNIDIRAHYERFLKIAHEKTGLLRGTDWAYKQEWTEKTKRDFFRDTYCKRFPPYSVLVFNFPVSPDAGHTPQNLLAEYIDASRRSKLKRRSRAISETNADEDEDSGSFWGDDEDEDEDEDMDPANRQEGGAEHSINDALGDVMMFGSGDESMQMDDNELGAIVSDFDEDEDLDELERQPKRQRREDGMSLQEMMEHVGQMDAQAEANYIPPAVQSGGDGNVAHQPTYFGDNGLGPNPFIDMEAGEN